MATQVKQRRPTPEQQAIREFDSDATIRRCWKDKLRYVGYRADQLRHEASQRRPGRMVHTDPEIQAAQEWDTNAGGCQEHFASKDIYVAMRRRELTAA